MVIFSTFTQRKTVCLITPSFVHLMILSRRHTVMLKTRSFWSAIINNVRPRREDALTGVQSPGHIKRSVNRKSKLNFPMKVINKHTCAGNWFSSPQLTFSRDRRFFLLSPSITKGVLHYSSFGCSDCCIWRRELLCSQQSLIYGRKFFADWTRHIDIE